MHSDNAQPLIILGTYEFAEEVADLAAGCNGFEVVAFAENRAQERCSRPLLGKPVIWIDQLVQLAETHVAICAIGSTRRPEFIEPVVRMGFRFATLVHPSAHVLGSTTIGEGSILSLGVLISSHAVLGRHVIVNRGAMVGHHTRIGDYVTVAPGANIAGRVTIGDSSYMGMGAVILNDLRIGSHSVVGAGSVVTEDVPDHVLVLGNPAVIARRNIEGY